MPDVDKPRFPLWCLFALTLTAALSLELWDWMDQIEYLARVSRISVLIPVVAASPVVFLLIPGRWLQFPRALFLVWLPWPCTAMLIGFRDFVDDRKGTPFNALFLAIVSFFTIFTPTIIVGMRRSRAGFDSPDRGGR